MRFVTVGTLITGVDSIETDVNEQKLTVIGEMDTVAVVKKLKKVGKVDIVSVGPAIEEKKEEKKEEKEEKKEEKPEEKKWRQYTSLDFQILSLYIPEGANDFWMR